MVGRKIWFYGFILFLVVFGWVQAASDDSRVQYLTRRIAMNPDDISSRYELAKIYYQSSGLADYFSVRSLLWTETAKRRNDLLKKLPPVSAENLQGFQAQLIPLLHFNPDNPAYLVLAGDYHYFNRQKETAKWYYQKAIMAAPASAEAYLALADFYLDEWQPIRVQELLKGFSGPRFSLRKGAACLQSGDYLLALGYLLQADPLQSKWQATRDKDLFKAYLAFAETGSTDQLLKEEYLQSVVSGTLFLELQGWSAFYKGDRKETQNIWSSGEKINPDYKFWRSMLLWLQPDKVVDSNNSGPDLHDSDLNSALKILQGRALINKGLLDSADKAYLAAIKYDRRSLVGYLGAGTVQLGKQNYSKALDLCNQGLAINPNFGPLLLKRAEVFRKLGRSPEASADRAAFTKIQIDAKHSLKLKAEIILNEQGANYLLVQGETNHLVGLWIYSDDSDWEWYPWWGSSIILKSGIKKVWIVPTGPGLSGEVLYLPAGKIKTNVPQISTPTFVNGQAILELPIKTKLVIECRDNHTVKSYVSDQLAQEHRIPLQFLKGVTSEMQLRFENEDGAWWITKLNLILPVFKDEQPSQYIVSSDNPITNHRQVTLHLSRQGSNDDQVKVSIGEVGRMTDWLPFQPEFDYLLSDGDGLKTIRARFQNYIAEIQEVTVDLELDSTPPIIHSIERIPLTPDLVQLSWASSESVTNQLRVFTNQGVWEMIPVSIDSSGRYQGAIPLSTSIFSQMIVKDKAGNLTVFSDQELNALFRKSVPYQFSVNEGKGLTNSRFIDVKPSGDTANLIWAVSNDLLSWSGWKKGDSSQLWRLNPGNGEQLVFIKYKRIDLSMAGFQVIPIRLDTIPPQIREISLKTVADKTMCNIKLDEPAQVRISIFGKRQITSDIISGNNLQYLDDHWLDVTTENPRGNDWIQLELTDKAGNIQKTSFFIKELGFAEDLPEK